jgi:hypothetical protein
VHNSTLCVVIRNVSWCPDLVVVSLHQYLSLLHLSVITLLLPSTTRQHVIHQLWGSLLLYRSVTADRHVRHTVKELTCLHHSSHINAKILPINRTRLPPLPPFSVRLTKSPSHFIPFLTSVQTGLERCELSCTRYSVAESTNLTITLRVQTTSIFNSTTKIIRKLSFLFTIVGTSCGFLFNVGSIKVYQITRT